MKRRLLGMALVCGVWATATAQAIAAPPLVEPYLVRGQLADGETALLAHLATHPEDDQARFGLGVLQVLRGVEGMAQSFYRHGLRDHANAIPFLRMPVGKNPDPQPISYVQFRAIFERFVADLARAETTLADVRGDDVKLPLHFGQIRLDIDGDGRGDDHEALWRLYAVLNREAGVSQEAAVQFVIVFDKGDVHWLRGYCHLLSALAEMVLAHDLSEFFERVGHLFFAKIQTPHPPLRAERGAWWDTDDYDLVDVIAAIHLLRFPVTEPRRMRKALAHLETVIAQSRLSWQAILEETDDDREWIPNPRQTGVIPGVRVTKEMVDGWHGFLDEAGAILAGKKLLPHWRLRDARGINLRRVFTEPTEFDLVLWVQGSAATPYLEDGELTSPATWAQLNNLFRGQFIGFALWFN